MAIRKIVSLIIALTLILTTLSLAGCSKEEEEDASFTSGDLGETIMVQIEMENGGIIKLELYPEHAPITVENFVNLVNDGFYDGLIFHRVIKNFMIQGGDPEGTGMGGSPNKIKGEFAANGVNNPIKHERGVISMARGKGMDSGSCQFFIVHETSPHLDGQYAAFGRVTSGMDIVDKICSEAEPTDNNGSIAKADQPRIAAITVREK